MNVLHIIAGLDVGGAELMLKRLVDVRQDNRSVRHSVISLTRIGKVGQQLQALGIEVHALDMRSILGIPRVLWQLARLIRASRCDIVQTWMYHADLLGGMAARLAGQRHVIWGIRRTELLTGDSVATRVIRRLCGRLSGWLPHTIVCAAEAARRSHAALGYNAARMVVVHNGFDTTRLTATVDQRLALRAQLGIAADEIVIGSLGSYKPAKDHQNFVRAAGLVAQQQPKVRFLLVGRDIDVSNAELSWSIEQTGHHDRFVLLSERADVQVCLAAMDMFCLHSRTEGFPNVVGEAMAMGLPCVVTDVGDAAVLVADGGVVVPREDSNALAQGLERLVALPTGARRELGQRAKARIHAEFTIERARERFEAVYRCVLNGEAR